MLRLLRGADITAVAHEVEVPVDQLEDWQRAFLEGGKAGLQAQIRLSGDRTLHRPRAAVTAPANEVIANDGGHERFMLRAIALARRTALEDRAGGPFAAVVVRDGAIVGEGTNRVIAEQDPTWHGEVAAIRDACRRCGTHDLSGCELYTTGEPCPLCYGAAWWARIRCIYYAASMEDARRFGDFDDSLIYEQLQLPAADRRLPVIQLLPAAMRPVWEAYHRLPGRQRY